jgi:chromosomal replication initiator protein
MLTPKDAWQATLGQLQLQLNRATFDTWLKGSEVMAYEDGEFMIRVRHAYAKDWLEKHLNHLIQRTLSTIFGRSVQVNYVVYLPNRQRMQPSLGPLWNGEGQEENNVEDHTTERPDYSEWDPRVTDQRSMLSDTSTSIPQTLLNHRYTFDSFVAGSSNQFAYAAAKSIAESPTPTYNPLFIYGGPGLGKTHLLHAIGFDCQDAGRSVIYVTAEAFMNELVMAIRAHTTAAFRERYRSIDVLLIDDIEFLAGKASTEEELYHTFNAIYSRNGQIVAAGRHHPHNLPALDERLRSRFEGGLQADIQVPELETRLEILELKSAAQGKHLPQDVAELLAQQATTSVRELEGLLTQVLGRATLTKQPLTMALAQQALGAKTSSPQSRRSTNLEDILEKTATYHQLSMDDLVGKRRTKDVSRARHIAIYLAREETEASLPQIGEALGGRNHSTVLHSYQKIAEEIESDEELQREVNLIRHQIYLIPKN